MLLLLFLLGIFAYVNFQVPKSRKFILETLVKGLQRLEYRGYDSAGKTNCVSYFYVKRQRYVVLEDVFRPSSSKECYV